MMQLPASVRVHVCVTPCDMRRSFDGLHALVRDHLKLDAFAGHIYVFSNKRKDRIKCLYWDHDGFCVWSERGNYVIPTGEDVERAGRCEMTAAELGALLSGIDLSTAQRRKRYRRRAA